MTLTQEEIAIVKSTVPVLQEHGLQITTTFYNKLFSAHPELSNMFSLPNQRGGHQQTALANAIFAYAAHIDDLPKLGAAVDHIANRHASLLVKAEHYPIVGKYLISAMGDVLGSALTDEIRDAWIVAYQQLASIFIQKEQSLYKEGVEPAWREWRDFRICKKEMEGQAAQSLYLEPTDREPLLSYSPGNYVTVQVPVEKFHGLLQNRQFTLSLAPAENDQVYRITVKKESSHGDNDEADASGLVSTLLHEKYNIGDCLKLSAPRGDFFLSSAVLQSNGPVVLLSLGVGATAVRPILGALVETSQNTRQVSYLNGAKSIDHVCFKDSLRGAKATIPSLKVMYFVTNDSPGESRHDQKDEIIRGRLDVDQPRVLDALHLGVSTTEYYICGKEDWMAGVRSNLRNKGVDMHRIHLELFRPGAL